MSEEKNIFIFEIKRKIFHIIPGLTLIYFLKKEILDKKKTGVLFILSLIGSLILKKYKFPFFERILLHIERKENMEKFPAKGMIYFLGGIFMSLLLFRKNIALGSLMILILGDPVSNLYGRKYGKILHPFSKTKCIEGNIAGMITGTLGSLCFLPFKTSVLSSAVSMFAEGIDFTIRGEKIDDNIIIPLTAGIVSTIIEKN